MVAEKQSSFHPPGRAVALMLTRVPNQPGPTVFHIVWDVVRMTSMVVSGSHKRWQVAYNPPEGNISGICVVLLPIG